MTGLWWASFDDALTISHTKDTKGSEGLRI